MVDPLRLRTLLERLSAEIADLRRLAGYDAETVLTDRDKLKSVKYGFVVAIEICIDVGNHLIASEGYRTPHNYGDVFAVLADEGHIADHDVATYAAMAGFRNLLVHGYAEVDDRRVVEILNERLDDLDRFRTAIASSVSGEGQPPSAP